MLVEPIIAGIAARCSRLRTGVDIGFSDAAVATRLRARFPALWMTVVSGDASRFSELPEGTVCASGKNNTLPFDGNQFEVAVMNGEIISTSLVREIHRVLRPDGLLFFSVLEEVRHGPTSTLSKLYNAFLKCGYDVVSVVRPPWWRFGRGGKTLTVCARKKNWHEQKPFKMFLLALALCAFLPSAFAGGDGDALATLLNSRSAMSPKAYAAAAADVRKAADGGGVLQKYVIALFSEDTNAPKPLRLSDKQRKNWLESSRTRIRQMAEQSDNPLAWYLLSLEKNDMPMLERAAEGGNVQAQNAWGTILVSQALSMPASSASNAVYTLEKGFACFRAAAVKKDANGMYNLGMCYMQGYGCTRNERDAFEWFHLAAERGHPEAINNIGGFYRDGICVATNAETSVRWFKKSADLGNPYGQLNYALALQRGDGVTRDDKAAAELLKLSADQGCPEAMTAYGMDLHKGRGVTQDLEAAFRQFRRAAEAGFPPAMDNLSVCYERGEGTPKDVLKSALWKMRARAAQGDPDARAWIQRNDQRNDNP